MAGVLTFGDGTVVTTLVLDGVQADLESTMRLAAKKFNAPGDPSIDAVATVYGFVIEKLSADLDLAFSAQSRTDALQTADAAVTPISLPNPPATTA